MNIIKLIDKTMSLLKNQGHSLSTLASIYSSSFKPLLEFFNDQGIIDYEKSLNDKLEKFYKAQLQKSIISRDTFNKRNRGLRIINEVYITGSYVWKVPHHEKVIIQNCFTLSIDQFIQTRNLVPLCIQFEKKTLDEFSEFCINADIMEPKYITGRSILMYIKSKALTCKKSMDKVGTALSKYIRYLYETNYINQELSSIVKVKSNRDHKVRPKFNSEILSLLLNSINRKTKVGKRDYAIISLASVTGLRSCELVNLKLSDIDWKNKVLTIVQSKTNVMLSLPLSEETLSCIADYILNGRPDTESPQLFIRCLIPFTKFHDGVSINNIIRRKLKIIGIDRTSGDGRTIHGIRRLLGTELINDSFPVDTVAQILGHQSIGPTRQYISLDIDGLRKCTLSFNALGDTL